MHFDVFTEGKSFFHHLDPRVKILVFIPLVFTIALLDNVGPAASFFLMGAAFLFFSKLDMKEVYTRVAALNVFILILWATLPFNVPGKGIFSVFGASFTIEGAVYTLIITLKANAILFFTVTLIGTTDVFSLAHALFHLKFPKKLVYLTMFMYRYVAVLHKEYDKLKDTVRVRAFAPKTDLKTFKTYAYMAGMLFLNSYERAERVYQALTLRGFRGDFPMLRHFHLHKEDVLFSVFMITVIIGRFMIWR